MDGFEKHEMDWGATQWRQGEYTIQKRDDSPRFTVHRNSVLIGVEKSLEQARKLVRDKMNEDIWDDED